MWMRRATRTASPLSVQLRCSISTIGVPIETLGGDQAVRVERWDTAHLRPELCVPWSTTRHR